MQLNQDMHKTVFIPQLTKQKRRYTLHTHTELLNHVKIPCRHMWQAGKPSQESTWLASPTKDRHCAHCFSGQTRREWSSWMTTTKGRLRVHQLQEQLRSVHCKLLVLVTGLLPTGTGPNQSLGQSFGSLLAKGINPAILSLHEAMCAKICGIHVTCCKKIHSWWFSIL